MRKKEKKRVPTETGTISTLLGRDTGIEGTLTFSEAIRIDGRIKGKLISDDGTVIIGENAVIDADIQVGVAIIRGRVNGRIEAKERIEVYAPAQVIGDICGPTITIDSGVVFNGKCEMQRPSDAAKGKSGPAGEPEKKGVSEDQKNTKNL